MLAVSTFFIAVLCFIIFGCERNPSKLSLDRYSIRGWTIKAGTYPAVKLPGVQVSIGENTITSNDSGYYVLTNITMGDQTIQISKSGYVSRTETINLDSDTHRDLYLLPEGISTSRVYGVVKNSLGNPIEDAYVFIDGPTTLTNSEGYFELSDVVQGGRHGRVTRNGYLMFEDDFNVSGESVEFNVEMVADLLAPPRNVSAEAQSRNSVYITWQPYDEKTSPDFPFNTLHGYIVYRYDWEEGNFKDVSDILGTSVGEFSDDEVDATTTVLIYKVLTVNIDRNDGLPMDSTYAKGYSLEETTEEGKHDAPRTMVVIPASEFLMGSSSSGPIHKVRLNAFLIDKYEVTNQEFADFLNDEAPDGPEVSVTTEGVPWLDTETDIAQVHFGKRYIGPSDTTWVEPADTTVNWADTLFQAGDTVYVPPSDTLIAWADTLVAWADSVTNWFVDFGFENNPAIGVTYYGADEYAQWAGKRLPTEAEWERAARFTDGRSYPWGNDVPTSAYCNYNLSRSFTEPIGSYGDYTSVEGVHDLAGNVWEWCSDWYEPYSAGDQINPTGPETGTYKILRGGSWRDTSPAMVSGSIRLFKTPDSMGNIIGFRCAKDIE